MGKDAKSVVRLDAEEREQLQEMITKGGRSAEILKRVRTLLQADESENGPGWTDTRVAEFAQTSLRTVERIRKRFVDEGLEAAIFRKNPGTRLYHKLDGEAEAQLIAVACSKPPTGRCRWTLELLAEKLVVLKVVESISQECVRQTLKKTNLNLT